MTMSDPISDMITRIRNGQRAQKSSVKTPASKMRGAILDVLQKEGYIRGYTKGENADGKPTLEIELKYSEGKPVIVEIQRISRPGR
ncbi:MAG: 30S ribosomal protein S8, partial [Alphaproteobacteria bacterium]